MVSTGLQGDAASVPSDARTPSRDSGQTMETILWVAGALYLFIGAAQAARNISRGVEGSSGPFLTFIAVTLLWPVMPRH